MFDDSFAIFKNGEDISIPIPCTDPLDVIFFGMLDMVRVNSRKNKDSQSKRNSLSNILNRISSFEGFLEILRIKELKKKKGNKGNHHIAMINQI
jgi:hypothetical protein